jgi:type VI secretion system protein ImpJ
MPWNSKVIWSEGMFLQPHHFQQHDRYIEHLVEGRTAFLRPYSWGLIELRLDEPLLALGKFALSSCRGVLADGTPFNIPADDDPPLPLEVPENVKDTLVLLALPIRRTGMEEADRSSKDSLARYQPGEIEVRDSNAGMETSAIVEVGKLRLRLVLEREALSAYTCLGLARIVEREKEGRIRLDEAFIPPCLDILATSHLPGFVKEILGFLHHRGEALAGLLSQPGPGGIAEIEDFLRLAVLNRYQPLFAHLSSVHGLHPESLYRIALQLAGELALFSPKQKRRPAEFPAYRHEALETAFTPVMEELRRLFSMDRVEHAIALPLEERKFGVWVAITDDRVRALLKSAAFVLAVNAHLSPEVIRTRFPAQAKIGSVEKIRELVNLHLPGIDLYPLPVAPRQIPFHAGFTYFELDHHSEYWKQLETSAAIAMHIAGEFPGLELEFWAIRGA